MTAFTIELAVEADHEHDVRDLANGIQYGIQSAQKDGSYPGVTVVGGPSVSTCPSA